LTIPASALDLLIVPTGTEHEMTPARWWLVGAIALGAAITVYLIFFCPTD
jgi:hypothetical protein